MDTTLNLSQKTHQELQSIITLLQREQSKIIAERDAFETKYNQLLEQLKVSNLKRFGQ